ncbi:hypothetical protein Lal_00019945, partial [Lupinus albus]
MARYQTETTLSYIHSWSRIQNQNRAHRLNMMAEARTKQKNLETHAKQTIVPLWESSCQALLNIKKRCVLFRLIYVWWNRVVVLKRWKRYFPGYIGEKKYQSNESDPWHMPSLI